MEAEREHTSVPHEERIRRQQLRLDELAVIADA
jgi:hypothetical protein